MVVCAIDPWTFDELGREGSDFSRAVEYALDLENHEAVFVRDHSLRGTRDHLGYATGNVDVLDNGDWLVMLGPASRCRRHDPGQRGGHAGRSRHRSGEAGHPFQGVARQ